MLKSSVFSGVQERLIPVKKAVSWSPGGGSAALLCNCATAIRLIGCLWVASRTRHRLVSAREPNKANLLFGQDRVLDICVSLFNHTTKRAMSASSHAAPRSEHERDAASMRKFHAAVRGVDGVLGSSRDMQQLTRTDWGRRADRLERRRLSRGYRTVGCPNNQAPKPPRMSDVHDVYRSRYGGSPQRG
jgi:hypothetical protein